MKTIAIISEDYIFIKLFIPLLEQKIPDCTILQCNNFTEVKDTLDKNHCDLIIADGILSGVASFEIVEHLRLDMGIIAPILFFSEMQPDYFRNKALDSGVTHFYKKPFSPVDASEEIRQLLQTEQITNE